MASGADQVHQMNSSEPRIPSGTLRFSNGAQVDATPYTDVQPSPPQAASGRAGEFLFVVVQLSGPASPDLHSKLSAAAGDTYWSTAGSSTAALRKAAIAANGHLVQFNARAEPSQHCVGALVLAVLHDDDVYVLQVGQGSASLLHRGRLQQFSAAKGLPQLGARQVADVRVHHAFSAVGDTLLLAAPSLTPLTGSDGLEVALAEADFPLLLSRLAQSAAESDFTALVARRSSLVLAPDLAETREPAETPSISALPSDMPQPEPPRRRRRPREKKESRLRLWANRVGPEIRDRLSSASQAAGQGLRSAGAWLGQGAKTLLRRTLPGRDETASRPFKEPSAAPDENRRLLMAIAVGIPVLLVIVVVVAYLSFGDEARFQGLIDKAQLEMDLARATDDPDEARRHLETALDYAADAAAWRPEDPDAARLYAEAEGALDVIDHVSRLTAVEIDEFGQGTEPNQLVVRGQMLFVLDSGAGWAVRLDLSPGGDSLATPTSLTELAVAGELIGVEQVATLLDCAWVDTAGGREASGLLILEETGGLLTYDPSWTGAGGGPRVTRSTLRDALAQSALAIGTYQGRLYVLDPVRNQIWRYQPEGDSYPYPPEQYFTSAPPKRLDDAVDMAIDGNVYVLYEDGTILRFLGGEVQPFDTQGVAGDLSAASRIAVDPSGLSGHLYVADPEGERIVVLAPNGAFLAEYRMQVPLDLLSALAVDETAGRLYLVSGQRLYSALLP